MFHPLAFIPLCASPAFIAAGIIMYLKPPKKINQIYGYRTKRSMASQEAWDFSQPLAGKQMVYFGLAYLSTSTSGILFPETKEGLATLITLALMIIGLVLLFRRIEKALEEKFG